MRVLTTCLLQKESFRTTSSEGSIEEHHQQARQQNESTGCTEIIKGEHSFQQLV